jgi:hypothetical protein
MNCAANLVFESSPPHTRTRARAHTHTHTHTQKSLISYLAGNKVNTSKTRRFILFTAVNTIYSENHTETHNTPCWQNAEFLMNVTPGGIFSYHCALIPNNIPKGNAKWASGSTTKVEYTHRNEPICIIQYWLIFLFHAQLQLNHRWRQLTYTKCNCCLGGGVFLLVPWNIMFLRNVTNHIVGGASHSSKQCWSNCVDIAFIWLTFIMILSLYTCKWTHASVHCPFIPICSPAACFSLYFMQWQHSNDPVIKRKILTSLLQQWNHAHLPMSTGTSSNQRVRLAWTRNNSRKRLQNDSFHVPLPPPLLFDPQPELFSPTVMLARCQIGHLITEGISHYWGQ